VEAIVADRKGAPRARKPLRITVKLKDTKGNVLIVRTENQWRSSGYKSLVIHVPHEGKRKRGMTLLHDDFEAAKRRVEKLVADAVKEGWLAERKSRAHRDQFESLPRAK
jgi:hypothetical protein